eukprot:CAMPEP_0183607726 /NCGR_PEP_ID=MMETSP0371-20130417/183603_1 /TAXON_ID=268820 /ORGANISM="Peridinium aciculiferum, Strain PAER-2" /LENGTH=181 /DNA_ID=CAMNT_0025819849 /DNA_START=288 /DNA_END=834 /DNA_ORIENTATION=+
MRSDSDARLPIPRVLPHHAVKVCVRHLLAVLVLDARDAASCPLKRFAAFALEHRDEAREFALASDSAKGVSPQSLPSLPNFPFPLPPAFLGRAMRMVASRSPELAELAQLPLSLAARLPGTSDAHGRLALAPVTSQAVGAVDVAPLQPANALLQLNGRHRPVTRPLLNLEDPIGGINEAKA